MRYKNIIITLVLSGTFACNSGDENEECKNRITNYSPENLKIEVDKGAIIDFYGEGAGCDESETWTYQFWLSNSTVSESLEAEVNSYQFLACDREVGNNKLTLKATDDEGDKASLTWNINVRDVTPQRPDCYEGAINSVKSGDFTNLQENMCSLRDQPAGNHCFGCPAAHLSAGGCAFGLQSTARRGHPLR